MNRITTTLRVSAAAAALTVTFAIFQTISIAYTSVPAAMLANTQTNTLVASK